MQEPNAKVSSQVNATVESACPLNRLALQEVAKTSDVSAATANSPRPSSRSILTPMPGYASRFDEAIRASEYITMASPSTRCRS